MGISLKVKDIDRIKARHSFTVVVYRRLQFSACLRQLGDASDKHDAPCAPIKQMGDEYDDHNNCKVEPRSVSDRLCSGCSCRETIIMIVGFVRMGLAEDQFSGIDLYRMGVILYTILWSICCLNFIKFVFLYRYRDDALCWTDR